MRRKHVTTVGLLTFIFAMWHPGSGAEAAGAWQLGALAALSRSETMVVADTAAAQTASDAPTIFVTSDRWEYAFGEDVEITVILSNESQSQIAGELAVTVDVSWLDSSDWATVITVEPRPFSIPGGGQVRESYELTMSDYGDSGLFRVIASAAGGEEIGGFSIAAGYDLNIRVAEEAQAGEEFEVTVEATNALTRPIRAIALQVSLPSATADTAAVETVEIPVLDAGESYEQTWQLTVPEGGYDNVVVVATSADGGSNKSSVPLTIVGESSLIVVVQNVRKALVGSPFTVWSEVHNVGLGPAEGVTATLHMPYELSLSDEASLLLGDIAAGESKLASWNAQALLSGSYAIEVSSGDAAGVTAAESAWVQVTEDGELEPQDIMELEPIEEMAATGDGNGDGRCTEVDALLALQMAVGLEPPIVETMDVNSDGSITEVDALLILQWAVTGGQCGS